MDEYVFYNNKKKYPLDGDVLVFVRFPRHKEYNLL
jgi:hypothetical protein